MQAIDTQKSAQHNFDDLIQRVSLLSNKDLTAFFEQLNAKIKGTKKTVAPSEEDILLKQIKNSVPTSVIRRFKALQSKQHDNSISEKEQEEIIIIINFIEEKSAERVELLAKLAKIKQVPLAELIKQFPLKNHYA